MALRLVFMGTPQFAVPTLVELAGHGYDIASVYTRAPQPAGRGMEQSPSAVEREARRLSLSVLTPTTLRSNEVVVAYGRILPEAILAAFPLGAFNLHASLLPRWRGAAPINRAIMAGDLETGVTVMQMEPGLDTGAIAIAERVPIGPDATAGNLHDQLAGLGADLMVRALAALERGLLTLTPQQDQQRGNPHRLDPALERGARSRARFIAVPGGMVRAGRIGQVGPRQCVARHQRRRSGCARHGAR